MDCVCVYQTNLNGSFLTLDVSPAIMQPQRQMAMHITKALKNKRHVVIESPTGTGKSAAILCSVLAWQRYNAKRNVTGDKTKIIYCSRTHSQVAQMVSSLKRTVSCTNSFYVNLSFSIFCTHFNCDTPISLIDRVWPLSVVEIVFVFINN